VKKHIAHLALAAGLAASLALYAIAPHLDDYAVNILVLAGINIILASIITLTLGPVLASAPAWQAQAAFFAALLAGGLFASFCGFLVGVPSLRLRGDYLAIVTLGFGEIIRVVIQNTNALGGARGLEGIPPYTNLLWTFGIATVAIYVVASLVNSTYGRGFISVRDDEIAAEAMGINTTKYKVAAFVIGAFFAGLAGGLYAHFISYIAPEGFNFLKSVDVVVMVILGGMGSTPGVAASAVLLTLMNELLRDFEQYRMIVFALLLIVLMIVRPQGLLGNFQRRKRKAPQP
jgi:branched-chain amino acid transport system permease protein